MHIPVFPSMGNATEQSLPAEYAGFHPLYGPYPIPGKFRVFFTNSWCQVTHNKDSNRITRPLTDTTNYIKKPKLCIYGCSYTWGTGNDDSSTYPFLIQSALPYYNVQNKGVFAAGNIIAYLQIKEEIRRNEQPAIACVSYASFHDQRNTMAREWALMIKESAKCPSNGYNEPKEAVEKIYFIDTLRLPQARLLNDSLYILYKSLKGALFPFSRYSVICNLINYYLSNRDEKKIRSNEVTKRIFFELNEMCKHHNIRLIITCIDNDKNTLAMQTYFKKLGIEYLSFGVDWHDKEYNLYPDEHPNEKANAIYAKKIVDYLIKHP